MSMYVVTVDPGSGSLLQPETFVVDAETIGKAYNMFWEKCIYDKKTSGLFQDLFVYGDSINDVILTRKNFKLYRPGSTDKRKMYCEAPNGEMCIGTISIIVYKIPDRMRDGYVLL